MPRERIRKDIVYKFGELSEEAQEKALENLSDINVDNDWWDSTYDDARNIGLEIDEFDVYRRTIGGRFTQSAEEVAKEIIKNHGEMCETYKTAENYLKELEAEKEKNMIENKGEEFPEDFLDTEEIDAKFKHSLLVDYLTILQSQYEHLTSKEGILETIKMNNYEFTEDGRIA